MTPPQAGPHGCDPATEKGFPGGEATYKLTPGGEVSQELLSMVRGAVSYRLSIRRGVSKFKSIG